MAGPTAASPERVTFQRVDPRMIYAVPSSQAIPSPPSADSQDAKRRRFNSNGVYIPAQAYPEATYSYAHSPVHSAVYPRPEMLQQIHHPVQGIPVTKQALISPPRPMYPRPPQLQAIRPPHPHHGARSSVALPPIETMVSQAPIKSSPMQSQTSGVEAMIMSIPVLNKIKVLGQISGPLPPPGLSSPKPEVRGAIIAIEGMDPSSVESMTNSLAEQLERAGNFAVRIFGGPDPYPILQKARSGSADGVRGTMTTEHYLSMLSAWHKVNTEMVEYITTRPGSEVVKHGSVNGGHNAIDHPMAGVDGRETLDEQVRSEEIVNPRTTDDIPESAISPKTISRAAELSILSPPPTKSGAQSMSAPPLKERAASLDTRPPPAMTFPRPLDSKRIPPPPRPSPPPPASLATATTSNSLSSRIPPPPTRRPEQATAESGTSTGTGKTLASSSHVTATTAMPIALVPHYQLTTVDAASVSMSISDGFSPPAHWQWFATLWRGAVGPDVTIVIKGPDDDADTTSGDAATATATTTNPTATGTRLASLPGQSGAPNGTTSLAREKSASLASSTGTTTSHTGVEIRLNDSRAVIVKTGLLGLSSSSSSSLSTAAAAAADGDKTGPSNAAQHAKELENWEKAKRRVGFEVEEYLRK